MVAGDGGRLQYEFTMSRNPNTKVPAAERRYKSFELKKQGYSYRDIQQVLGCSHTQAHKDVMRVLREMQPSQQDVDYHRNMLLTRYEHIIKSLTGKLNAGDLHEGPTYDRILKTLNQIADITGVKEKQQVQTPSEMDLSAYADLLEQADSQ